MTKQKKEHETHGQPDTKATIDLARPSHKDGEHTGLAVTVDYEKYFHFLEDADISDQDKRELLQTLWGIICEFVTLGFGVHPVQEAQKPCGKREEISAKPSLTAPNRVEWEGKAIAKSFDDATELETNPVVGGLET